MSFVVLYDGQCEVCQSLLSWLVALDSRGVTSGAPLEDIELEAIHPDLSLDECLQELHIVDHDGRIYRGWRACAELAKVSPWTWLIGVLGSHPPLSWAGNVAYRWIASNRYMLSKCRGGVCRTNNVESIRKRASLVPFWSCYVFGFVVRAPLSLWYGLLGIWRNMVNWVATYRRRVDLLSGRLTVMFLGGLTTEVVPLLFGERFWAVLYKGVLFDPGSLKMRRSLRKHLSTLPEGSVKYVVATHHHEEHVGNLEIIATACRAPCWMSSLTLAILRDFPRLPWSRRFAIGQPKSLTIDVELLADGSPVGETGLIAYEAPGHCDDEMVFYDPQEKVLIAGDAFLGSYFSTPNPDVDSKRWVDSLKRLLDLDIQVLIEGHGRIHTMRPDLPDVPGVVIRDDPKRALREKLDYMTWVREQIDTGLEEGLSVKAIEATCFPWTTRRVWENFAGYKLIDLLSGGHFSNSELIRSFTRVKGQTEVFPYERVLKVYS